MRYIAPLLTPLLTVLTLTGCGVAQSSAPKSASPYVATALGRIDSEGESRQLVAAADGVIDRLFVERGQAITAGEKLLGIDCGPRLAEINARVALGQKASAAAITIRSGPRTQELQAADAEINAAQSALREQQQRLSMAEALVDYGMIRCSRISRNTDRNNSSVWT